MKNSTIALFSIRSRRGAARRRALVGGLLLAFASLAWSQSGFHLPEEDPYTTDDGTVQLAWVEDPDGVTKERFYEVRRWDAGIGGEGILVYEGQDTASFLSGLPEGEYEIKVRWRELDGAYSDWGQESLTVNVDYIDYRLVIGLMCAGFVTFVAIVLSILLGHKAARDYEAKES